MVRFLRLAAMTSALTSALTAAMVLAAATPLPDGTVVDRVPVAPPSAEQLAKARAHYPAYADAVEKLHLEAITYLSDGLQVKGMLATPAGAGPFPAIVFNRGGNREFGGLTPAEFRGFTAMFVAAGYVVVGSDYRGNGGGEGHEEFGGADVDDVLALLPLLRHEPKVDITRLGIYGSSRGGLMAYEALARTTAFRAAVIESGVSDAFQTVKDRPAMESGVFREIIPGYAEHRDAALTARSPVLWADRLSKTTPILVTHGTADWRVGPRDALAMGRALFDAHVPYRLVMFEGGSHGNNEFAVEQENMEIAWFDRYVRDRAPLPNLTPHGN